jgi:hypothetical protein
MKLTAKLNLVSILGLTAIAGVGYAAFTFSDDATISSLSQAHITQVQEFGEVEVTNTNLNIVLDQKEITWTGSVKAVRKGQCANLDTTNTWTATLSDNLAYYVRFAGDASTYTNVVWEDNVEISLPKLEYVEEHKPTTLSQYNVMTSVLAGEMVNFSFTAAK